MSNYDDRPVDIENPPTDLDGAYTPLIATPERTPKPEEEVQLDGIPAVQKAGYGNWTWAEQRCARRSGLTVSEASAIQVAYRAYQKDGNMQELYEYVMQQFNAFKAELQLKRGNILGIRGRPYESLLSAVASVENVLAISTSSHLIGSTAWAVRSWILTWTSRNQRETLQERMRTMETMVKLVELFSPNIDKSAEQEMLRQDAEVQISASDRLRA
jgi:hypothetical protein